MMNWNSDGVVDGLEVLVEAFLRRLVVIGRDDQNGVRAASLGVARKLDRLDSVVGARAGDHGNPAARFVDADVDGAVVLLVGERRALSGCSDRHQPVRPGADLPVDQRAIGRLVDLAVFERGDQRRHRSVKLRSLFHGSRSARLAPGRSPWSARRRTHRPDAHAGERGSAPRATVYILFTKNGPSSLNGAGPMKISRFGPLLAVAGAVCLGAAAWLRGSIEGRSPPPPPKVALNEADLAAWSAHADVAAPRPGPTADLKSPLTVGVGGARASSRPQPGRDRSDKDAKVQLAYANPEGAAPTLAARPTPAPALTVAVPEPSAPAPSPEPSTPAADPALPPPPPASQAAILYRKGDVAGLTALAASATDAAERSALEWASLRADPHPSFAALADFLEAHPTWPSRGWIREQQEADLAAHPQAPTKVAAFFASDPPQSSAGKIAAARAAQALGRSEEASQIIRALWREGPFDALAESVILREFGSSLAKADHAYRADRLLYTGYLSAGARAAALAGPDVLALAQARIGAARAPMSPALIKAVPPALRNDPGLLFSRVQYARRAGRVYEAAVLLSLAPHDRAALVNPDRWWSERKMVARTLLDLDEPQLAFEVCDQTVQPDSSEAQVDAAFHAGWIALRFLDDAPLAAKSFARAAEAAENPLSVARAAYWQGRAAEAAGDSEGAKGFYTRAASVPIAYLRPTRCATSR